MDVKLMMDQPMTHRRPWFRTPAVILGSVTMLVGVLVLSPLPLRDSITGASRNPTQFEWVEARAGEWDKGADLLIAKVREAGVKRGQIISIDAHSSSENGEAIFTAYYSKALMSKGDLNIKYKSDNADYDWPKFYDRACAAAGSDTTDVISITSSINSGGDAVTYVFSYDAPASTPESREITWVESRSGSWNGAAIDIIAKIKATGAKRGQVLGIDAHNNGCSHEAMFSAYLDLTAPGYGDLDIKFVSVGGSASWESYYNQALAAVNTDTITYTASCNSGGEVAGYVFTYIGNKR